MYLNEILLCLHIMRSQNINCFTLTQFFIVIQFLSYQPDLKLIGAFLKAANHLGLHVSLTTQVSGLGRSVCQQQMEFGWVRALEEKRRFCCILSCFSILQFITKIYIQVAVYSVLQRWIKRTRLICVLNIDHKVSVKSLTN